MENIFESVVTEIAPRFAKLMNKEPVDRRRRIQTVKMKMKQIPDLLYLH
jgi:hypothetical protein